MKAGLVQFVVEVELTRTVLVTLQHLSPQAPAVALASATHTRLP